MLVALYVWLRTILAIIITLLHHRLLPVALQLHSVLVLWLLNGQCRTILMLIIHGLGTNHFNAVVRRDGWPYSLQISGNFYCEDRL